MSEFGSLMSAASFVVAMIFLTEDGAYSPEAGLVASGAMVLFTIVAIVGYVIEYKTAKSVVKRDREAAKPR